VPGGDLRQRVARAVGCSPHSPQTHAARVGQGAAVGVDEPGLLHYMKHNLVIYERNIIMNAVFHEELWIGFARRVEVKPLAPGFWQVTLNFGFMNQPNIPKALALCASHGLEIDAMSTSFFLSRETVVPTNGSEMALWRENLFEAMSRNAGQAVDYFRIPHNAVIELGSRVRI
jgi:KUP system potassium uptake protein